MPGARDSRTQSDTDWTGSQGIPWPAPRPFAVLWKKSQQGRPRSADPAADQEDGRHDGNHEDADQCRIFNQGGAAVVASEALRFGEACFQSWVLSRSLTQRN